ncbi:hypothetical protein K458DRAFT_137349 [Lentithecium fluviatile CBS 122367]|uniref:Uncharacterized protein n=1 Tax=Lentithecium fluviatile CBS 122367 TaxID=1168545 RepID=A0A6G1IKS6_9PLEO|nr:hypothetical protein K458DRAFT_137349 [Lentithecium fluviatile CBS 122367]
MAPGRKNDTTTPISEPEVQGPVPTRPSLMQRVSALFSSVPRRRVGITTRPLTAPESRYSLINRALRRRSCRQSENGGEADQSLVQKPCPYDPNTLQSFPRLDRHCSCGLPWPRVRSRHLPLTPCDDCRNKTPNSHIAVNARRSASRGVTPTRQTVVSASAASGSLVPPIPIRNVPDALLDRPRPHVPALELLSTSRRRPSNRRPPTRRGSRAESDGGSTFDIILGKSPPKSSKSRSTDTPTPPKLHHLHGLPGSRQFPYAHKHEVPAHLAAIQAGTPSPVRDFQVEAERTANTPTPGITDWTRTVQYGLGRTPVPVRRTPNPQTPRSTSRSAHRQPANSPGSSSENTRQRPSAHLNRGTPFRPGPTPTTLQAIEEARSMTVCDGQAVNIEFELQRTRVYGSRTAAPTRPPSQLPNGVSAGSSSSDDSNFSTGTMPPTPHEVDGVRRETPDGFGMPNGLPRMRGGGQGGRLVCASSMQNRISDCHLPMCGCCGYKTPKKLSDDPPPRVVTPERVARALRQNRTAPLPRHLRAHAACPGSSCPKEPARNDISTCLSHSSDLAQARQQSSPTPDREIPHLRGGGGFDLKDTDRVPATLWFLAGGRGHPVTVSSWNKQKPKKRIGGLFGMAIYGHKAGTPYKSRQADNTGDQNGNPGFSGKKKVLFKLPDDSPTSSSSSSSSSESSSEGGRDAGSGSRGQGHEPAVGTSGPEDTPASTGPRDSPPTADPPATSATQEPPPPPIQKDTPAAGTDSTRLPPKPEPGASGDGPSGEDAANSPPANGAPDNGAETAIATSGSSFEPSAFEGSPTEEDSTPLVDAPNYNDEANAPNGEHNAPNANPARDNSSGGTGPNPEPSAAQGGTAAEDIDNSRRTPKPNATEHSPPSPDAEPTTKGPGDSGPPPDSAGHTNAAAGDGQGSTASEDNTSSDNSVPAANDQAPDNPAADNADAGADATSNGTTASSEPPPAGEEAPLANDDAARALRERARRPYSGPAVAEDSAWG